MKNPPWGDGGASEDTDSIATRQPCPWPCLFADHHEALTDATGYVRGTLCELCGQFITRADWLEQVANLPQPGAAAA